MFTEKTKIFLDCLRKHDFYEISITETRFFCDFYCNGSFILADLGI